MDRKQQTVSVSCSHTHTHTDGEACCWLQSAVVSVLQARFKVCMFPRCTGHSVKKTTTQKKIWGKVRNKPSESRKHFFSLVLWNTLNWGIPPPTFHLYHTTTPPSLHPSLHSYCGACQMSLHHRTTEEEEEEEEEQTGEKKKKTSVERTLEEKKRFVWIKMGKFEHYILWVGSCFYPDCHAIN